MSLAHAARPHLKQSQKTVKSSVHNKGAGQELASKEGNGFGLFVRSLIGLDKDAALEAMAQFLSDTSANTKQITFLKLIVDQLTQDGAMSDSRPYVIPFIDLAPTGPTAIFSIAKVDEIRAVLTEIRECAVAQKLCRTVCNLKDG